MFFSSDIENGFLIDVASLGNAGGVGRVLLVIEAVLVRGRRRDPRPPGLLLPPVLEDGLDDLEPLADDLRLLPRLLRPAPHPGQLRQLAHQPPDLVKLNIRLDQQSTLDLRIRLEHYLVQNIQSEKYIDIFYYSTVTNICIYWHWADLGSSAGLGPGVWSPHGCVTCQASRVTVSHTLHRRVSALLYTLYSIQDTGYRMGSTSPQRLHTASVCFPPERGQCRRCRRHRRDTGSRIQQEARPEAGGWTNQCWPELQTTLHTYILT